MSEWSFIVIISIFLGVLWFFQSLEGYPESWEIFSDWSYVTFYGEIIAVAGTCVLATGIPCTIVFLTASIVNVLAFVISPITWVNLIIFVPMFIGITYLLSRLARGGG